MSAQTHLHTNSVMQAMTSFAHRPCLVHYSACKDERNQATHALHLTRQICDLNRWKRMLENRLLEIQLCLRAERYAAVSDGSDSGDSRQAACDTWSHAQLFCAECWHSSQVPNALPLHKCQLMSGASMRSLSHLASAGLISDYCVSVTSDQHVLIA